MNDTSELVTGWLDQWQSEVGLCFADKRLLLRALTHRSYVNEHEDVEGDNERLEFLGDAVLDFVVGDMLFQRYPEMPEGQLTRLRSALVRTESLAELARSIQLGQALRMGRGEAASGGRDRQGILCGAFEAVVGALYLEQGLEAVKQFVLPRLGDLLEQVLASGLHLDARSHLQEWSQAHRGITPVYHLVGATGPDHDKQFEVEVLIGDEVVGHGAGHSKQSAAQSAARDALKNLQAILPSATAPAG